MEEGEWLRRQGQNTLSRGSQLGGGPATLRSPGRGDLSRILETAGGAGHWSGHPPSSALRHTPGPLCTPRPLCAPRPVELVREAPGWTLGFCTHIAFPDFQARRGFCSRETKLVTLHPATVVQALGRRGRVLSWRRILGSGPPASRLRGPGGPCQRRLGQSSGEKARAAGAGPPLGSRPLPRPDAPSLPRLVPPPCGARPLWVRPGHLSWRRAWFQNLQEWTTTQSSLGSDADSGNSRRPCGHWIRLQARLQSCSRTHPSPASVSFISKLGTTRRHSENPLGFARTPLSEGVQPHGVCLAVPSPAGDPTARGGASVVLSPLPQHALVQAPGGRGSLLEQEAPRRRHPEMTPGHVAE